MKGMVILFAIALVISCGMASGPYANGPAYPMKSGVMNLETIPGEAGMQRAETLIPDMKVEDGYKSVHFMTNVGDSSNDQQPEFPWPQML